MSDVWDFLRKPGGTVAAPPQAPSRAEVNDSLRRLEIRETLRATRDRMCSLQPAAHSVIDFKAVLAWIGWVDAQCMVLPKADLERALVKILRRASRAVEVPELYQSIEVLERKRLELEKTVKRLGDGKVDLEKQLSHLDAEKERLEGRLKAVERQTGLPYDEIVRRLQSFARLRRGTVELTAYRSKLRSDCLAAQSQLSKLQVQINRITADFQRFASSKGGNVYGPLTLLLVLQPARPREAQGPEAAGALGRLLTTPAIIPAMPRTTAT